MKKLLYSMLLMAATFMTATVFVSCDDEDETPKPSRQEVKKSWYEAHLSAAFLDAFDINLTIYKSDKTTSTMALKKSEGKEYKYDCGDSIMHGLSFRTTVENINIDSVVARISQKGDFDALYKALELDKPICYMFGCEYYRIDGKGIGMTIPLVIEGDSLQKNGTESLINDIKTVLDVSLEEIKEYTEQ